MAKWLGCFGLNILLFIRVRTLSLENALSLMRFMSFFASLFVRTIWPALAIHPFDDGGCDARCAFRNNAKIKFSSDDETIKTNSANRWVKWRTKAMQYHVIAHRMGEQNIHSLPGKRQQHCDALPSISVWLSFFICLTEKDQNLSNNNREHFIKKLKTNKVLQSQRWLRRRELNANTQLIVGRIFWVCRRRLEINRQKSCSSALIRHTAVARAKTTLTAIDDTRRHTESGPPPLNFVETTK